MTDIIASVPSEPPGDLIKDKAPDEHVHDGDLLTSKETHPETGTDENKASSVLDSAHLLTKEGLLDHHAETLSVKDESHIAKEDGLGEVGRVVESSTEEVDGKGPSEGDLAVHVQVHDEKSKDIGQTTVDAIHGEPTPNLSDTTQVVPTLPEHDSSVTHLLEKPIVTEPTLDSNTVNEDIQQSQAIESAIQPDLEVEQGTNKEVAEEISTPEVISEVAKEGDSNGHEDAPLVKEVNEDDNAQKQESVHARDHITSQETSHHEDETVISESQVTQNDEHVEIKPTPGEEVAPIVSEQSIEQHHEVEAVHDEEQGSKHEPIESKETDIEVTHVHHEGTVDAPTEPVGEDIQQPSQTVQEPTPSVIPHTTEAATIEHDLNVPSRITSAEASQEAAQPVHDESPKSNQPGTQSEENVISVPETVVNDAKEEVASSQVEMKEETAPVEIASSRPVEVDPTLQTIVNDAVKPVYETATIVEKAAPEGTSGLQSEEAHKALKIKEETLNPPVQVVESVSHVLEPTIEEELPSNSSDAEETVPEITAETLAIVHPEETKDEPKDVEIEAEGNPSTAEIYEEATLEVASASTAQIPVDVADKKESEEPEPLPESSAHTHSSTESTPIEVEHDEHANQAEEAVSPQESLDKSEHEAPEILHDREDDRHFSEASVVEAVAEKANEIAAPVDEVKHGDTETSTQTAVEPHEADVSQVLEGEKDVYSKDADETDTADLPPHHSTLSINKVEDAHRVEEGKPELENPHEPFSISVEPATPLAGDYRADDFEEEEPIQQHVDHSVVEKEGEGQSIPTDVKSREISTPPTVNAVDEPQTVVQIPQSTDGIRKENVPESTSSNVHQQHGTGEVEVTATEVEGHPPHDKHAHEHGILVDTAVSQEKEEPLSEVVDEVTLPEESSTVVGNEDSRDAETDLTAMDDNTSIRQEAFLVKPEITDDGKDSVLDTNVERQTGVISRSDESEGTSSSHETAIPLISKVDTDIQSSTLDHNSTEDHSTFSADHLTEGKELHDSDHTVPLHAEPPTEVVHVDHDELGKSLSHIAEASSPEASMHFELGEFATKSRSRDIQEESVFEPSVAVDTDKESAEQPTPASVLQTTEKMSNITLDKEITVEKIPVHRPSLISFNSDLVGTIPDSKDDDPSVLDSSTIPGIPDEGEGAAAADEIETVPKDAVETLVVPSLIDAADEPVPVPQKDESRPKDALHTIKDETKVDETKESTIPHRDVNPASKEPAEDISETVTSSELGVPVNETRNLAVDTNVEAPSERPSSPWTPSYSVTVQGPGIPVEESPEEPVESYGEDSLQPSSSHNEVPSEVDVPSQDVEEAILEEATELDNRTPTQMPAAGPSLEGEKLEERTLDLSEPIERPKSPYPPSYSVTHIGSGFDPSAVENDVELGLPHEKDSFEGDIAYHADSSSGSSVQKSPALKMDETHVLDEEELIQSSKEVDESSNVPEVPSSPRSDLGIMTPSFDTRSEVSVASREPCAPTSPRLDPEEPLFPGEPSRTPVLAPITALAPSEFIPSDESRSAVPDFSTHSLLEHGEETDEHEYHAHDRTIAVDDAPEQDAAQIVPPSTAVPRDNHEHEIAETSSATSGEYDGTVRRNESEFDNSSCDGDIDTDHPESSVESSVSESNWSEIERSTSNGESERVNLLPRSETALSSTAFDQEDVEVSTSLDTDSGLTTDSGDHLTTVDESPVIVPSRTQDVASIPTDSELSEPEFVTNPYIVDDSATSQTDSISELDTIGEDDGSVTPGDRNDLPQIPSSISHVESTDTEGHTEIVAPEEHRADVSQSLKLDGEIAAVDSPVVRESLPEHLEVEQGDINLKMPEIDAVTDCGDVEDAVLSATHTKDNGVIEREVTAAMDDRITAPVVKVIDSGVDVGGEADEVPELKTFPSLSIPTAEGEPSLPRLITPTLTTVIEDDVAEFETISPPPPVPRKRHESTASRFFPGAWVSTTPSLPERPSLDVAQGEFSRPSSDSGLQSPTSDVEEDKKGRCVIM